MGEALPRQDGENDRYSADLSTCAQGKLGPAPTIIFAFRQRAPRDRGRRDYAGKAGCAGKIERRSRDRRRSRGRENRGGR